MKMTIWITILVGMISMSCNNHAPQKTKENYDQEVAALIRDSAIVVDVRTPEEFETGHVRRSVNIPLSELPEKISTLPTDKPIITVCRSGMRSKNAAAILRQNGFKNVYDGGTWRRIEPFVK